MARSVGGFRRPSCWRGLACAASRQSGYPGREKKATTATAAVPTVTIAATTIAVPTVSTAAVTASCSVGADVVFEA